MNDNISVILSKNFKKRIPLLINILEEYGIKEQKRVYMQAFLFPSSYYVNRLISLISKIDFKLTESYMLPTKAKTNFLAKSKLDYHKFMLALEKIRKANIIISSHKVFKEDLLDYIFDEGVIEPYDAIIIDDFDSFLEKSNKDIETIKQAIEAYSKKHNTYVILFMKDSNLKNHFLNWEIAQIDDPLEFKFDDKNYNIIDIC